MPRFLAEVNRVLRKGGHFLFADLRPAKDQEQLDQQLSDSEMTVLEKENITPNVVEALRRDSERKMALIEQSISKRLVSTFRRFAAIEGSDVFEGFTDGTIVYHRYVLRK